LGVAVRGDPKLRSRVAELEVEAAEQTSSAFVFIKPHAVTAEVKSLVRKQLAANGISVASEGFIPAERIDQERLIDTHYGAIAAKAVKLKPAELTVQPKATDLFRKTFDVSWEDSIKQGMVFNAADGCEKLGCSSDEMGQKWATLKKDVTLIKFGGGFYCGKVDGIFVLNGFYMDMRKAFTQPGTGIYFYTVRWNAGALSWQDFRCRVLGATDPKSAAPGSLRNQVFGDWQALGLKSVPNTGDNGVHASASPFEALAERANWLGQGLAGDRFGRAMLAKGVPLKMVRAWTDDPAVLFEGQRQSVFDLLEDLDAADCLEKCRLISMEN